MLDLHLMKEDIAILGDLDVASTSNKHLHGAFWAKVRLQNILGLYEVNITWINISCVR